MNILKKSRHAVYNLKYHLVLVTKYRNKCITLEIQNYLRENSEHIILNHKGQLLEFNGEEDHIHMLLDLPPATHLTKFVNCLKSATSRKVRKKFKKHLEKFFWKPVFWSRSYCIITTGGANIQMIKEYIQNQGS